MKNILDVSSKQAIFGEGVKFFSQEINQLYRPCWQWVCIPDSYDIVYSNNNLTGHKFYQILLKEWFYLPKKNGFLVIDYHPSELISPIMVEDEFWLQWGWSYEILKHCIISDEDAFSDSAKIENQLILDVKTYESNQDLWFDDFDNPTLRSKKWRIVIRKTVECMKENDSMDKWTFWIITNGTRGQWMSDLISSIRALNVPNYEILVCWNYQANPRDGDLTYIPFNKRSNKWWITKKKNLILNSSKYENIVIVHDRYVFDSQWYLWMIKWGPNFELLTTEQYFQNTDIRFLDRVEILNSTKTDPLSLRSWNLCFLIAEMDNKDFYHSTCLGGGVLILKKWIWIKLCETLFWNNYEDNEYSASSTQRGAYPRINPYSKLYTRQYEKVLEISKQQADYILEYNPVNFCYNYKALTTRAFKKRIFSYFLLIWKNYFWRVILSRLRNFYHKSGFAKKWSI